MTIEKTKHRNNLNAVRLIAALMVVRGHMGDFTLTGSSLLWGYSTHGTGVHILFLLGGYLITESWRRDPNIFRYALKRFFRLWPPLVFAVLFTSCIVGPLFTTLPVKDYFTNPEFTAYFSALRFKINFLLPGDVFSTNPYPGSVNGSLWTLPIEVMAYGILGAALFTITNICKNSRCQKYMMPAITAAIAVLYLMIEYNFVNIDGKIIYGVALRTAVPMILCFFVGSCYSLAIPKTALNLPAAVLFAALMNCVLSSSPVYSVLRMLMLAYLLFSFGLSDTVLTWVPQRDIAYGIYLYAFPVQQSVVAVCVQHGWSVANVNCLMFVSLLLIIPLALVSEKMIEEPSRKICKKICSYIK